MDLESIEGYFSEGTLALMSGVAIIVTITFFIYEIIPLFSDRPMIFMFSVIALIVCVISSISFYLFEITLLSDVIGKLLTGLTVTIFAVILFHVGRAYGISSLPEVALIGFLGFASTLPLTRGVLIPLFGHGVSESSGKEFEEIDEIDEDEDDELEPDIEDEIEGPEEGIEEGDDLTQEDEPW